MNRRKLYRRLTQGPRHNLAFSDLAKAIQRHLTRAEEQT